VSGNRCVAEQDTLLRPYLISRPQDCVIKLHRSSSYHNVGSVTLPCICAMCACLACDYQSAPYALPKGLLEMCSTCLHAIHMLDMNEDASSMDFIEFTCIFVDFHMYQVHKHMRK
jgi:hypothetical protein